MATHSENRPGNEFYLHVDPTVEKEDEENFELSNCKCPCIREWKATHLLKVYSVGHGRKRALLIGINYTGTQNELNGMCIRAKYVYTKYDEMCNFLCTYT